MVHWRNRYIVLHVDDSSNDHLLVQEAASMAEVPLVFIDLFNFESTVAYLSGVGRFADREHFPLPALALLDYSLDGHTGADVLSWMRAQPGFQHLPVVMYSGSPLPEQINQCYRFGANHFLVKPSALGRIVAVVKALYQFIGMPGSSSSALFSLPEYRLPHVGPVSTGSEIGPEVQPLD